MLISYVWPMRYEKKAYIHDLKVKRALCSTNWVENNVKVFKNVDFLCLTKEVWIKAYLHDHKVKRALRSTNWVENNVKTKGARFE